MSEIDDLNAEINELKDALKKSKRRRGYAVVALFKFEGNPPQPLVDLPEGKRVGLPTPGYDWPWWHDQHGNVHWHTPDNKKPGGWDWTHVGARVFTTTTEADQWIKTSDEAKFLKDSGAVVFTCSLTDYYMP